MLRPLRPPTQKTRPRKLGKTLKKPSIVFPQKDLPPFFWKKQSFRESNYYFCQNIQKTKKVGSLESVYVPENFYNFCSSIFGSTTLGHPHRIRTRVAVISVVEWNSWHLTMFFDGCQCTKVSIPHPPPKWPPSCG